MHKLARVGKNGKKMENKKTDISLTQMECKPPSKYVNDV